MRHFAPVPAGCYPPNDTAAYRSSEKRAPREAAIRIPHTVSERRGPHYGAEALRPHAADLTTLVAGGVAQGQRIIVHGRVTDEHGRPEANALVEVWQANAAGRYRHDGDRHDAPLDPYFTGAGQVVTDADGRYEFVTIEPGAYPWGNHFNAWRPKHIHFSLFGRAWATRLVTQMYFPGDPLLPLDPIYMGIADAGARERLVSSFDLARTVPDHALAYRFDIVLRGALETPWEERP
ncbi:MAG: protocatechuate 3,4-dioxygenase subunit beta [Gammaproteobacteria bacterium]